MEPVQLPNPVVTSTTGSQFFRSASLPLTTAGDSSPYVMSTSRSLGVQPTAAVSTSAAATGQRREKDIEGALCNHRARVRRRATGAQHARSAPPAHVDFFSKRAT